MTCDKDGKCNCKCDVIGDKCNECEFGHHGFPNCTGKYSLKLDQHQGIMATFLCTETAKFRLGGCYCSTNGTIKCDIYGNCICREGYTGTKCDQCQSGYSKNASGICIGMKALTKLAST